MRFILFLLLLFSVSGLRAQHGLHCGADEMRIQSLQKNPGLAPGIASREAALEQHTQNYIQSQTVNERGGSVYIIPVVFHVIHNYGPENISDAQILNSIEVLNKNYRKLNADTVDIITPFKPLAADCQIELRLAQKDPSGNCTKGINRIASPTTYSGGHEVKDLIHWDPTKYLNVYVVANAAGLAGHAVWPADADTIPEWDGIVIAHDYVGSIGTSNPLRSVVLSHELGHYLNLHHIWGGNNVPGFYYLPVAQAGNCAHDDLVSDTPNTIGWSTCNLNGASCGNTVDNVQNFMDYAYCARMFTPGQAARMHACLNSSIAGRNNLWSPANLMATGTDGPSLLCAADFSYNKSLVCVGQSITFTDNSYHGVSTRLWDFPGGNASSLNDSVVTVSYTTPGIYSVSLTAGNGSSTVSVSQNNIITVLPATGASGQLLESFENVSAIPDNNWHIINPQGDAGFELYNGAGYSGTKSVRFDNFSTPANLNDELILAPRNITGFPSIQVSFRYAFAFRDSTITDDLLKISVSNDCGMTWAIRKTLGTSLLPTAAPVATAFVPSDPDEWELATVTNISNAYIGPDFMLKFTWTSDGGNNLYLDDINIAANIGIDESEFDTGERVYPQPSDGIVVMEWTNYFSGPLQVELFDITGKKIKSLYTGNTQPGAFRLESDLSELPAGFYLIRRSGMKSSRTFPLIIH